MARAQARPSLSGFPFAALARPLTLAERRRVGLQLQKLLAWQRTLERWPSARGAGFPDATPFVSAYARGSLLGCYGSPEGTPRERIARAFLLALHDGRYSSPAGLRAELVLELAYPLCPERVSLRDLERRLEPGHHAIGCAREGVLPVLLLPAACRDAGLGTKRALELVAHKAGTTVAGLRSSALYLCRTETVVVRGRAERGAAADAAEWLARRIQPSGHVEFGCDPRHGQRVETGEFHHGRAAVVIRALAEHAGHAPAVRRARRWLEREIQSGLGGHAVPGWPKGRAEIAGTLALALLAGVRVERELLELARDPAVRKHPWHAAQVVAALGAEAPPALFARCARDLERNPWAPWTAMAAERVGDARVLARATRALVDSVRKHPPYRGGVGPGAMPELALTAVVVEALSARTDASSRRAVVAAREFLSRWQIQEPVPAAFDPELALGAFPLAPVVPLLRSDVTAHALRALSG